VRVSRLLFASRSPRLGSLKGKPIIWHPKNAPPKGMYGWVNKQDKLGNFWVPQVLVKTKDIHKWIEKRASDLGKDKGTIALVIREAHDDYAYFGMFWTYLKLKSQDYHPYYGDWFTNLDIFPNEV